MQIQQVYNNKIKIIILKFMLKFYLKILTTKNEYFISLNFLSISEL